MAAPPIVTLVDGNAPSDPQFWLDAATQVVRSYCGWHISPIITEEILIDGPGGYLLHLPTKNAISVSEVKNDGTDITPDVELSKDGMLALGCGRWSRHFQGVELTLEHGFEQEDVADLAGIISKLAARAATTAGNISRQAAGTMNVSYGTSGGLPPGVELLELEKAQLARYYMRNQ